MTDTTDPDEWVEIDPDETTPFDPDNGVLPVEFENGTDLVDRILGIPSLPRDMVDGAFETGLMFVVSLVLLAVVSVIEHGVGSEHVITTTASILAVLPLMAWTAYLGLSIFGAIPAAALWYTIFGALPGETTPLVGAVLLISGAAGAEWLRKQRLTDDDTTGANIVRTGIPLYESEDTSTTTLSADIDAETVSNTTSDDQDEVGSETDTDSESERSESDADTDSDTQVAGGSAVEGETQLGDVTSSDISSDTEADLGDGDGNDDNETGVQGGDVADTLESLGDDTLETQIMNTPSDETNSSSSADSQVHDDDTGESDAVIGGVDEKAVTPDELGEDGDATMSANETEQEAVAFLKENLDGVDGAVVTDTEDGTELTFTVDVLSELDAESEALSLVLAATQYLNLDRVGPVVTIRMESPDDDVAVTVTLEEEITTAIQSAGGFTEDVVNDVGQDIISRIQVSGSDATELYDTWVLSKVEGVDTITVDEDTARFDFEIVFMNDTPTEVGRQLFDQFNAEMFMSVFFVGSGCTFDEVEFRGVSHEGETLVTLTLTTELADRMRSGELGSVGDLGGELIETVELDVPEPETEEAAREQLLSRYRQTASEYVEVKQVVPMGSELEVTYEMQNVRDRLTDDDAFLQKRDIDEEELTDLMIEDMAEFTSETVNGYIDTANLDQITFLVSIGSNEPTFKYRIDSEWIEAYYDDELDNGELVGNVVESFGPL